MQAINQIREKAKSSTTVKTTANVTLKAVTSSSQASNILNNNISFLRLSNTLWKTITLTSQNLDEKISRLIEKGKYFNCKKKRHIIFNCLEKAKIFTIIDALYNIENIN